MGTKPDGGRIAARGLQYQYVSTLEYALDLLLQNPEATTRIEGADGSASIDDIDFDVVNTDGRRLVAAQVKTSTAAGGVSASSAFDVLVQLILKADADEYLLRYGAAPSLAAKELAAVLASRAPVFQLRSDLQRILAKSPARLSQLNDLGPDDVSKLSRTRLVFDPRDSHEILASLRERLRALRNASAAGLGEISAGILAGYLVSSLMRRAAEGPPELPGSELESLVLTPTEDLARILGSRDWGMVIGPMPLPPDVTRPDVMDALTSALDHTSGRTINQVVLSGLSGIGKSSMASAYIAERADVYDWIIWVDAQTEASLRSGFEIAAMHMCGLKPEHVRELDSAQLRARIHADLDRAPGRWLLVFDDLRDTRTAEPWLARRGHGDIIVTSVNAVVRLTNATQVTVPIMEETECEQLLAARLNVSEADRPAVRTHLQRLADGLGRWPLALELGAGYMTTCDLGLSDVESYLHNLKLRSLDDEDAIPIGYPRTLSAVIRTSIEAVGDRAGDSAAPELAVGMLACAAYLTPRCIPTNLLAVAVIVDGALDAQADDHRGPIKVDPGVFPVLEAVRELRRFSLVSIDSPLPESAEENQWAATDQTVAVNSIVQDLLRADASYAPSTLVNNLVAHTDRWLTAAFGLGRMGRAAVMLPHAAALAEHALALDIRTPEVAMLLGNLARTYQYIDAVAEAERLILAQVDILRDPECARGAMLEDAYIAVAASYFCFSDPQHSTITVQTAIDGLHHVHTAAERLVTVYPTAATTMVLSVLSIFDANRFGDGAIPEELASLLQAFRDLESQLPTTPLSQDLNRLRQVELLVNSGQTIEGETLLRQLLPSEFLDGPLRIRVRLRLRLIDALSHQKRWREVRERIVEVRELMQCEHGELVPTSLVGQTAFNVALPACITWLASGNVEAALVLDELFAWPATERAGEHMEQWRARHLDMIRAFHLASVGDVPQALADLERLGAVPPPGDRVLTEDEQAWQTAQGVLFDVVRRLAAAQPRAELAANISTPNTDETRPWMETAYRRHRRATIDFATGPTHTFGERQFEMVVASLAVYLESGIDRNPALDLVYALSYGLDGFGVKAQPWITRLSVHDNETGESCNLGTDTPVWSEDGTFTGHCILVVPSKGELLDPTIDQLSVFRERYTGPMVVRVGLPHSSQAPPAVSDFAGRTVSIPRDPIEVKYHLSGRKQNSLIAPDNPHIRARLAMYKRAGRELAAAMLRIQRIESDG